MTTNRKRKRETRGRCAGIADPPQDSVRSGYDAWVRNLRTDEPKKTLRAIDKEPKQPNRNHIK